MGVDHRESSFKYSNLAQCVHKATSNSRKDGQVASQSKAVAMGESGLSLIRSKHKIMMLMMRVD